MQIYIKHTRDTNNQPIAINRGWLNKMILKLTEQPDALPLLTLNPMEVKALETALGIRRPYMRTATNQIIATKIQNELIPKFPVNLGPIQQGWGPRAAAAMPARA